jgi:hypothetical protein
MRFAIHPDSTLPKLPVGTQNVSGRRATGTRPRSRRPALITRAQLMLLTADSRMRSRNGASLNIAFTRSWQSSNVPSIATVRTFGESTVVICLRCTSLVRPCG